MSCFLHNTLHNTPSLGDPAHLVVLQPQVSEACEVTP